MTTTEPVLNVSDHARVLKGTKWLDEVFPTWYRHVDLERFDISSSYNCILGQVWPAEDYFSQSVKAAFATAGYVFDEEEYNDLYQWATAHGFDSFDDVDAANAAWTRIVKARRPS